MWAPVPHLRFHRRNESPRVLRWYRRPRSRGTVRSMAVDDFRMIRTEHRLSRNDVLATEGATVDVISILQAMPAEYLPQDTLETTLTQDNVSANAFSNYFGKLFDLPVDDLVYAQILYASGVPIGGSSVNVIY